MNAEFLRDSLPLRNVALGLALLALALLLSGCFRSTDAQSGSVPTSDPEMAIELPRQEEVRLPFTVSGWAVDLAVSEGPGIDVVQIVDDGCEGAVIGIAEYGLERTDIQKRYGEQFRYSGWQFVVNRLRPGDHTLAVRTKSPGAEDYNQCQAIQVTVE